MTLEEVIADELHSGMAHTLISDGHYTAASKSIANAVRAFLGSEKAVQRAAAAIKSDVSARYKFEAQARAALSSIGGE